MAQPGIIGLTGLARSGKDTIADHLATTYGYRQVSLADGVRTAALNLDPLVQANCVERLSVTVERDGWEVAKQFPDVRRLLQRLGTEAGWMMHGQGLWLDYAGKSITVGDKIVVSDIRFDHEATWVRRFAGQLWRVVRPEHAPVSTAHLSEQGDFAVDHTLTNDGSVDDLYAAVDDLMASFD